MRGHWVWDRKVGLTWSKKSPTRTVNFAASTENAMPGAAVKLWVSASGFTRVTSAQFTLKWNPAVLQYVGTGDFNLTDLGAGNFGSAQTSQGKLTISWDDASLAGGTVADGTRLFSVQFTAIGANGTSSTVEFADDPTVREVTVDLAGAQFVRQNGAVTIGTSASTISISTTDATAAEAGGDSGVFTITRTGSTASQLTVNYAIGGTATPAADYISLPGVVSIPSGSATTTITVVPIDDALIDPNESVIVRLVGGAGYELSAQSSATVTITDNDPSGPVINKPTISTIPDRQIRKNAFTDDPPIAFTVSDTETPAENLTVTVTTDNTALVPVGQNNIQLAGTGSQRFIILKPAIDKSGIADITVSVTDADRNTASTTFKLTVLSDAPTISSIPNQTIAKGASTGALAFAIRDETFFGFLKLSVDSSNKALVPVSGIVLGGNVNSADRTVTVTPLADQAGVTTITITVTDADGLTASATFTLSVTLPTVKLTPLAGNDGTINPNVTVNKNAGEDQLFMAQPANGFEVDKWFVNQREVQIGGAAYTMRSVQTDAVVSVSFRAVPTRAIRLEGDLGFGEVAVGTSVERKLTLFSEGSSPLTVNSITYPAGFSGSWSGVIEPGQSREIIVTFRPAIATDYSGKIEIVSNKTSGTSTRPVSGRGKEQAVTTRWDFANASPIIIQDNRTAQPYPSTITVSGVNGAVNRVTVALAGLTHTYTRDLGVLLVGPRGQKVVLMRKAGGKGTGAAVGNVNLTFADSATSALPSNTQINSGTHRPSDFAPGANLPVSAPAGPYAQTLGAFNNVDPNGVWSLYVADTEPEDVGTITRGWSLAFSTEKTEVNTAPAISTIANQTIVRGTATARLVFTIADKETDASALKVTAASSNTLLVSAAEIFLGGAGSVRTLMIDPVPGQVGTATITLAVADAAGAVATTAFTLTVTAPSSRTPGDFDGDGLADILFQEQSGVLASWLMNGVSLVAGRYLEPSNVGDTSYRIVASADFNQDQKLDILFQRSDGTLAVWFMDGTALSNTSLLQPSEPEAANWRVKAVADLDGDAKSDLVLQRPDGAIEVWIMNGVSRVAIRTIEPLSRTDEHWSIVGAGDFNRDGKSDLVFQHTNGDLVVWHLDNFVASGASLVPSNPGDSRLRVKSTVDRNHDGKPDLLFQRQSDGALVIWLMDGITRISSQTINPAPPGPSWEVVGP